MNVPDLKTVGEWAGVAATFYILVRQQINARAGKARGEATQQKVNEIHATTANGQMDILRSRAVGLRTLAVLQDTPENRLAATKAEQDLLDYLRAIGIPTDAPQADQGTTVTRNT